MILEVIRNTADALGHATEGVNAELSNIQLDSGDTKPPDIVEILDTSTSDVAARGSSGPDWPVLVVSVDTPAVQEGLPSQQATDSATVETTIRYVTSDPDSAASVEDTLYTLRAIVRSIHNLQGRASDRKRNGIQMIKPNEMTFGETREEVGDGVVTGAVIVDWFVRDTDT